MMSYIWVNQLHNRLYWTAKPLNLAFIWGTAKKNPQESTRGSPGVNQGWPCMTPAIALWSIRVEAVLPQGWPWGKPGSTLGSSRDDLGWHQGWPWHQAVAISPGFKQGQPYLTPGSTLGWSRVDPGLPQGWTWGKTGLLASIWNYHAKGRYGDSIIEVVSYRVLVAPINFHLIWALLSLKVVCFSLNFP